jgi:Domain of unknown function (DUF6431)
VSPLFERFDHRSWLAHKQAHDASHDWIKYRRGFCKLCKRTLTFLPAFSLPYTHYSLVARSQVLRRRFVEHCSWESAAPPLKDPNRIPDPSTLRRWCRSLDSSPAFSFLRRTLSAVSHRLNLSATRLQLSPQSENWELTLRFRLLFQKDYLILQCSSHGNDLWIVNHQYGDRYPSNLCSRPSTQARPT